MSSESKSDQPKPTLDREAFQQLLAAAFVLQEHNDHLAKINPGLPIALRQIQLMSGRNDLDLESFLTLVAERLRQMSGATGVSICVVENGALRPLASAGVATRAPGGAIAANSVVATERLCNGKAFHTPDAERDVRLDLGLCRHAGIGSLLAVSIPSQGGVAGLIELRSTNTNLFAELEASCRWTAGLVGELLARDAGRAAKPRLSRLLHANAGEEITPQPADEDTETSACRVCGEPLRGGEVFCGNCSMPAPAQEGLQSKWASLWFMQRAQETLVARKPDEKARLAEAAVSPAGGAVAGRAAAKTKPLAQEATPTPSAKPAEAEEVWGPLRAALERGKFARFRRAMRAAIERIRDSFHAQPTRLPARRLVLVSAAIVLVLALLEWNASQTSSSSSSSSDGTWFGSLLAQFGLAQDAPHEPNYPGNPDVRVWVDANTGLYYCPGASRYGQTASGHFTRQRAAQQEQIEPATRMPCW